MNNILPETQSGFREKHGTNTALLKVVNDGATALDKSCCTILVLPDKSKAFDLVNFNLLVAKLKYIGFENATHEWLCSYIKGRSRRVFLKTHACSSTKETSSGVPQGSVLGPIFFSIYVFDLPATLLKCQNHLYADDIELYLSFPYQEI